MTRPPRGRLRRDLIRLSAAAALSGRGPRGRSKDDVLPTPHPPAFIGTPSPHRPARARRYVTVGRRCAHGS